MKEFNNLEEIKKYYNKETDTYIFEEDGYLIDIKLNFNLDINSNIKAKDINALDINAFNINADNINAWDIKANNINYYAVCISYTNIKCRKITGRRKNCIHFVLDGKLEVEDE